MAARPYIVVIGGPNGAGKTTIARAVVEESIGMTRFVRAAGPSASDAASEWAE